MGVGKLLVNECHSIFFTLRIYNKTKMYNPFAFWVTHIIYRISYGVCSDFSHFTIFKLN